MLAIDPSTVTGLRSAKHLVVFTGAGVSAESGIATFRDKQTGLWERFDAHELATPQAFSRDPALVWGWYEWRRAQVLRASPNPAHLAIAQLAVLAPQFTLITQNVDDLHERAGSSNVLHLHGELMRPRCERCHRPWRYPSGIPDIPESGCPIEPPACPHCQAHIRPGVVWFGESLPEREWLAARTAASGCDALLCVGTSSLVQPAASLTRMAIANGAITVQINPNKTEIDDEVTCSLHGQAGEVLPELLKILQRAD
jgi:NAD-dependent deacetylase